MKLTPENILAALEEQIRNSQQTLHEADYCPARTREQVADLARKYGSPVLDVGTGSRACLAVILAQKGISVTAVDRASSAVHIARERAAGNPECDLKVRQADAVRLPYADHSFQAVTAFDALCHADDPVSVVKEMFRVCAQRGAVLIAELNDLGRQLTRHLDDGFQNNLPDLLSGLCRNCQRIDEAHHVIYICEKG
ncbi:MAG: class I SAM-dependent methyltransferase [Anaerolineales bacterium]|nr:class I SAM-dependent methyltransferase [Anaerolineales bacterium]